MSNAVNSTEKDLVYVFEYRIYTNSRDNIPRIGDFIFITIVDNYGHNGKKEMQVHHLSIEYTPVGTEWKYKADIGLEVGVS